MYDDERRQKRRKVGKEVKGEREKQRRMFSRREKRARAKKKQKSQWKRKKGEDKEEGERIKNKQENVLRTLLNKVCCANMRV